MNYYNPYLYSIPGYRFNTIPNAGIVKKMFGGINFHSILNGTQRTLNIINQTIPLIKQAQPIIKNAKTMFKVMNEFKKIDNNTSVNNSNIKSNIEKIKPSQSYSEGPTFFI
ncbi:MAG: hypothetical protein IJ715_00890 [Bacilli bacterium]|nr:hypothetical protein [Bacilli bacterium]